MTNYIANDSTCWRCGYKKAEAYIPMDQKWEVKDGKWVPAGEPEMTGAKARIFCQKCNAEWEGWAFNTDKTESF